jgi:fatty acid amide hydrolase 2
VEAVEAHIERIRSVNGPLNAVVDERFDLARAEAVLADEHVQKTPPSELPPLHGVPFTVKECFALQGMPNTSGLRSRRGIVSNTDAPVVHRARSAGAIPLGVTNLSELCMWMESNNPVYGRSSNPYDITRTVGGSSGGEGAIIGAGGSPFGIGSDVGGSIRMPAFFNGIFGHKPTSGLVPNAGQYPAAQGRADRYLTTGPLCRRAEDLWPLLQIMANPEAPGGARDDPTSNPSVTPAVDLSTLRVIVVPDNGSRRVNPEVRDALNECASALADRGAQVEHARFPNLKRSFEIWSTLLREHNPQHFRDLLENGQALSIPTELLKVALGKGEHTLPALLLARFETATWLTKSETWELEVACRALRSEIEQSLGTSGVLLYPPYTRPAPRHREPILTPFDWVYTAIFNTLEMPVTQVPTGLSSRGLPLGVQVVGRRNDDARTIAVAAVLDDALGGWIPPWRVSPSVQGNS